MIVGRDASFVEVAGLTALSVAEAPPDADADDEEEGSDGYEYG